MRPGRRISIDYGAARVGVAVSSADGLFCSPLKTISVSEKALEELVACISEVDPLEVYVGLPLNLQGHHTKSTEDALSLARKISQLLKCDVRLVDERMSTRQAQGQLHASGRNARTSRVIIDAAAASLILEGAIALEQSTGRIPGKPIEEFDAK